VPDAANPARVSAAPSVASDLERQLVGDVEVVGGAVVVALLFGATTLRRRTA
jgi:hypothetical protein